ncbi:hypothetical protein AQUCO_00700711v1 [Aquilegia coerulea]|uniref:Snakin-1 n=1 Tax=Aquilegia coerulea TaxID=218851 RepID=A0A2G5ELH3_AQUCA|nr:hypothetical protein AQUCO_00700711v1 [Aquilegia coerulea]
MKLVIPTLLLISFLLASSLLPTTFAGLSKGFCDSKCKDRCAKAGVLDRCLKYCAICCSECKCVPSGTYGNKHQCPCYRDKKSSKGSSKCP